MNQNPNQHKAVLTVNVGSSSLKFSVYEGNFEPICLLSGGIEGLYTPHPALSCSQPDCGKYGPERLNACTLAEALDEIIAIVRGNNLLPRISAVGHRLVHGGKFYYEPTKLTPDVIADIHNAIPFARDHLIQELEAVTYFQKTFPELPQYACFDTYFHTALPQVAKTYSFPKLIRKKGVEKFGFHGLSCESIYDQLITEFPEVANSKLIIAHLGNGASMTAVLDGRSIENTMGLTPCGGLLMSSRTGDLDPVVPLYLQDMLKLSSQSIYNLVAHESGLKGLSGLSGDLKELLRVESKNPDAKLAVDSFCYHAKKHLGSLAAVLGGCDAIVFTGGIGQHLSVVRQRICSGLEFLGIQLDEYANQTQAKQVSKADSKVQVIVLPTNEERVMAKSTLCAMGARCYDIAV